MSVPAAGARPIRVLFPCTGLGREQRGFEAFTRECASALRGVPGLSLEVFGGGGVDVRSPERTVPNLPRSSASARLLGRILSRDPYFIEQLTFFAGFLPHLISRAPDVVYFADLNLGNACWHWRRLAGQRFRLLFYNGGPTTRPFTRCDIVQQVSPAHLASALERGERADRQVLLPHGMAIVPELIQAPDSESARIRASLGVPIGGPLVLSVGTLSCGHKRMDYVIREVAALPAPRPHLLLLGAETAETPVVRALAMELLDGACTLRTVPREVVLEAYRAADAFVLASLDEGFGLAIVEALAAGLPCIVHDTPNTAYLCGPHALRADLRPAGALLPLIAAALGDTDAGRRRARHAWVRARFSWDELRDRYVDMLRASADGRRPAWAGVGE